MNELEWGRTTRFRAMLQTLIAPPATSGLISRVRNWFTPPPPNTSKRKLLLALAAIGRRVWVPSGHGDADGHLEWIERCERFADDAPTAADVYELGQLHEPVPPVPVAYLFYLVALRAPAPLEGVQRMRAEIATTFPAITALIDDYFPEDSEAGCAALREVLGNPFHPIALLPEWHTDTVRALAQQMYATGDFSAMPVLADALEDAGCNDDAILTHCRGPGPHVRGCFCVDAILKKA